MRVLNGDEAPVRENLVAVTGFPPEDHLVLRTPSPR
jgi:hypothetical protein